MHAAPTGTQAEEVSAQKKILNRRQAVPKPVAVHQVGTLLRRVAGRLQSKRDGAFRPKTPNLSHDRYPTQKVDWLGDMFVGPQRNGSTNIVRVC
jgi:hypothetical protein